MATKETKPNLFRRMSGWLQSNIASVLLAVALSFTVWIVAAQEGNPPTEFSIGSSVEIEMVGLEDGLVITNEYTTSTRIQLRALESDIPSITIDDIQVIADLSGLPPGSYQVPVQVEIASQATLVSASPNVIRVDLERRSDRTMPVQFNITGTLPTGYTYDDRDIRLTPSEVTVTGPESLVDLVAEIVASANIDGLRDPFESEITLTAFDADGTPIEGVVIAPASLDVLIPIYQESGFREVAIRVPTVGRPASGYYTSSRIVTPASVTLRGDPAVLAELPPLINTRSVDLTGLTDDLIVEVALDLPAGVTAVETATAQVLITIAAQQDSRSVIATVEIIGLGEGLEVTIAPEEVEVFLSGPLPVLQSMDTTEDITVTLDLLDLGPGTYQLEPTIQLAESTIAIDSVLPEVIEVEITTATE